MTPEQHQTYLSEMVAVVEDTMTKVVTSKIDSLRKDFDDYIKEDLAWKEIATPIIKAGTNLTGASKLAVYFMGGLATIAGGIAVIKIAIINLIK